MSLRGPPRWRLRRRAEPPPFAIGDRKTRPGPAGRASPDGRTQTVSAWDTQITSCGNRGDDPELRFTPPGQPVARFRIGNTPRYRDNASGEWKDGDSLFLTVNVWRE